MANHDIPTLLLGLLAVSFVFYMVINRWNFLRVPSIVIYIVFGSILGNSGVLSQPALESGLVSGLGKFGFLFLMFLSGLEIDISALRSGSLVSRGQERATGGKIASNGREHSPLAVGATLFGANLVLAAAVASVIAKFDPSVHAWMLTLILSTTSLGIIMPVLKEAGLIRTMYGQTLLTSALIADVATLLAVSVGASVAIGSSPLHLIWLLAILIPVAIVYLTLRTARKKPSLSSYLPHRPIDQVRGILAFVALCSLVTSFTGAEPILGSFMAGLMIAALEFAGKERLKENAEAIGYGFIVPIFFITVGLHFHAKQFFGSPEAWKWVPFLIASAFVIKILPTLWLLRTIQVRRATAGGILLSARLSLVIAASAIGIRIGAIPQTMADALLVMAVFTCLLSPVLFMWLIS